MKPLHTIVLTHGGGRLGNQLLQLGHQLAFAREYAGEFRVVDMAFWRFWAFFELTRTNPLCVYPDRPGGLWAILELVARSTSLLPDRLQRYQYETMNRAAFHVVSMFPGVQSIVLRSDQEVDLASSDYRNTLRRYSVTLLKGWQFWSWDLFRKHEDFVRDSLAPNRKTADKARSFITSLREKYGVLVGVLIRQSDYRHKENWGGRFYFETERYVAWMSDVGKLFPCERVGFVVASEVRQDKGLFAGLDVHMATGAAGENGHYIESLVELSMCDLIVAPPSTFASWAAFMGQSRILQLVDRDQCIQEDQILEGGFAELRDHAV